MHENEIDITKELAKKLLEEQFPHWAQFPIKPALPDGTDSKIYAYVFPEQLTPFYA